MGNKPSKSKRRNKHGRKRHRRFRIYRPGGNLQAQAQPSAGFSLNVDRTRFPDFALFKQNFIYGGGRSADVEHQHNQGNRCGHHEDVVGEFLREEINNIPGIEKGHWCDAQNCPCKISKTIGSKKRKKKKKKRSSGKKRRSKKTKKKSSKKKKVKKSKKKKRSKTKTDSKTSSKGAKSRKKSKTDSEENNSEQSETASKKTSKKSKNPKGKKTTNKKKSTASSSWKQMFYLFNTKSATKNKNRKNKSKKRQKTSNKTEQKENGKKSKKNSKSTSKKGSAEDEEHSSSLKNAIKIAREADIMLKAIKPVIEFCNTQKQNKQSEKTKSEETAEKIKELERRLKLQEELENVENQIRNEMAAKPIQSLKPQSTRTQMLPTTPINFKTSFSTSTDSVTVELATYHPPIPTTSAPYTAAFFIADTTQVNKTNCHPQIAITPKRSSYSTKRLKYHDIWHKHEPYNTDQVEMNYEKPDLDRGGILFERFKSTTISDEPLSGLWTSTNVPAVKIVGLTSFLALCWVILCIINLHIFNNVIMWKKLINNLTATLKEKYEIIQHY